jgi:hypothetical protein
MRLAVIYALAFVVPLSVKADECQDVLSYGYNRDYSSGSYSSTQALKNSICSHAEKASDHGSKAGLSIPGVGSLDFGSSSDNREIQGWCHTTSSDTSIDLKYNNAIERVNDIVIKKWEECMSLPGPKATLSLNADGRSAIATLAYRPDGLQTQTPVQAIELENLICPNLIKVKTLGQRISFLCTRKDPYSTSRMAVRLKTLNSPPVAEMLPLTKPLKPKYNIAGDTRMPDGTVFVRQDGSSVGWSYENPSFTHLFTGLYYSETEFVGYQTRVNRQNGCTVKMKITGFVTGDRKFNHNGVIAEDSPSNCDLPKGFSENLPHAY